MKYTYSIYTMEFLDRLAAGEFEKGPQYLTVFLKSLPIEVCTQYMDYIINLNKA